MWWMILLAAAFAGILVWQTTAQQFAWNLVLFLLVFVALWVFFTPAWLSQRFWRHQCAAGLRWLPDHWSTVALALAGYYGFAILAQWSGTHPPLVGALVEHLLWIALLLASTHVLAAQWLHLAPLNRLADWIEGRDDADDDDAPARPELFLVANQLYTYPEAVALASSVFNGRLATYDEVLHVANRVPNWGEVPGWIHGTRVVSPDGNGKLLLEHMSDEQGKYLQFGAVVFGIKPAPTDFERRMLQVDGTTDIATDDAALIALKMQYVRTHRSDFASVIGIPLQTSPEIHRS